MKKYIVNVPAHVSRISSWAEFESELPKGSMVLNKKFPGCGMTYYYLHNDKPAILCAPRNSLLINKAEQLDKEKDKYGYNSLTGNRIDYFYFRPSNKTNQEQRKQENDQCFMALKSFLMCNHASPFLPNQNIEYIPKILVTYDSLPTIYDKIRDSGIEFQIIMDESHVLFQDYTMKPEVIERALCILNQHPNVIYLSATPIMEEYLQQMEHFRDLPYVELNWVKERVRNVMVYYIPMSSTVDAASKVIDTYKQTGVFNTIGGHESTEAVFFINNVLDIVKIILWNELLPEEVNILVADDPKNRKMLKDHLGEGYSIGKIPTEGKRHKTYTFCSKTVFFGCDFYSKCASTYIFADGNLRCMSTDIATDMHQIVGRQRLSCNVFRNQCTVFVKTTIGHLISESEFEASQRIKWETSASIAESWNSLPQDAIEATTVKRNKCPYVVIYQDPITELWCAKNSINALLSERRAWELTNMVYRDHDSVQSLMLGENFSVAQQPSLPPVMNCFIRSFNEERDTAKKMHLFCCFFDNHIDLIELIEQLPYFMAEYRNYYRVLGTERISKHSFILSRIRKEYQAEMMRNYLQHEFESHFGTDGSYLRSDIKAVIQSIYDSAGLNIKAKATDLADYYELHEVKLSVNGKRLAGYKIKRYGNI